MKTTNELKTRHLTVYGHFLQRKYTRGCEVPKIRLCGKWLKDAGFQVGNPIKVTITENELRISVPKNTDTFHP